MKKLLILAISLTSTSLQAQTYTQLQWGIDKTVNPYNIAINVNNIWYNFGNFTPGTGPGIYVTSLAVNSAPYSQKSITVSSAPSYSYPYTNPTTFNGDFSNTFLPFSYTVNGAATLGQPTTGYQWSPAVTPIQSYTVNNSGWNQSTSNNDGRTGFSVYRTNVVSNGQGDSGAYYGGCWVYGTKAGATSWLANPACILLNGNLNAGANGTYLQGIGDVTFTDSGFDAAVFADSRLFYRTNNSAALGQVWVGYSSSSRGTKNIDNAINIYGPTTVGVDTVLATNTSAAVNMAANQKIILNSTSTPINGINWYGNNFGGSWLTHSSSASQVQIGYNNNIAASFTSASGTTDHFLIGAAANTAYLLAEGPDANIYNLFATKGAAAHIFRTGDSSGPIAFEIDPVASAVNFIKVAPNITGSAPTLSTYSATDTDVGLNINTQGSGALVVTSNTFGLTSAGAARLGKVSSSTGSLAFANASSANLTTLQAGNASAAVTYTLPTAAPGGSGYALVSTAGGVMSWASPVTIVTLTPGTTPTSGGAAGQLMYDTGSVLQESANLVFASNTLTVGKATSATGALALGGATSGTATITAQAAAGTPTLTLPNTSGTLVSTASAPLSISSTTGAISITGAAGQILAGATPAFTATPTLGVNATTTGTLGFANGGATGATVTVQNNGATTAYNFNLPTTVGTAGYLLTSQAGGASAMTWTSPTTTVNGQSCTLGSSCTVTAAASSIPFPVTVSGTVTSGGIPYFSSATAMSSSAVLGSGQIVLGGGAGAAPSTSANASISTGALTLGAAGTQGSVTMGGSTSGTLQIKPAAAAGTGSVLTFPGGTTDFSATGGTSQVVRQSTAGGAFTVSQLANTDISGLGTASTVNTGTSGATIPLLNGTNTWSGNQTFTSTSAIFQNASSFQPQLQVINQANDAYGAYYITVKSRGTSPTAVQAGDTLGTFLFKGYDSNNTLQNSSSAIASIVTSVGAGSITSYLSFGGQAQFVTPIASTSTTTGTVTISGGAGIAGAIYGGTVISAGTAHLTTASSPTLSTCGTSPTVATGSSNNAGQFTTGSATGTACTVTFATAYPNYAFCTVSPASAAAGNSFYISASSKTAFTVTTTVSSQTYNYTCFGN